MRVLIVEDDPIVAFSAAGVLTDGGHEVIGPAYSVEDAWDLMTHEKPEFAVIDINLAGHDEGINLARGLKATYGLHAWFVSGQIAAARANPDAALGLLRKPYDPRSLAQSITVAAALMAGAVPPPPLVPVGLEVFS